MLKKIICDYINICLVCLFLFFHSFHSQTIFAQTDDWEMTVNDNGILVYTRLPDDSDFKELKIEFKVNSRLSEIVSVLANVKHYPKWIYTCDSAFLIEKTGFAEINYYIHLDLPWPISDRDMVQHSKLEQDEESLEVKIRSNAIPGILPEQENVIRISQNSILWRLVPLSPNETMIYYHIKNNPGGFLPAWMVNLAIDSGPRQTIKGLIEMLKNVENLEKFDYVKDYVEIN